MAMDTIMVLCLILCTVLIIATVVISVFVYIRFSEVLIWTNHQLKVADKKCQEYTEYTCDRSNETYTTDKSEEKYAVEGMLPHMAYIKITLRSGKIANCAGTLISEYFILTAARCVQFVKKEGIMVKLGSVYNTNDTTGTWFKVDEIYIHDEYTDTTIFNDIALLKLDKKVVFDRKIRPICLDTDLDLDDTSTFGNVTLSGWSLDESEQTPESLQVLNAYMGKSVLTMCEDDWGSYFNWAVICAGHQIIRRSICRIDFGGPLQMPIVNACPNTYQQLGIAISNNPQCTKNMKETLIVTYTKLERFVPWIVSIVWPDDRWQYPNPSWFQSLFI